MTDRRFSRSSFHQKIQHFSGISQKIFHREAASNVKKTQRFHKNVASIKLVI
jgi:hypothetical protein